LSVLLPIEKLALGANKLASNWKALQMVALQKSDHKKRNGRQKATRHPHRFVIFVHSLVHFRVLAIVI
jgi:hypothetical protein